MAEGDDIGPVSSTDEVTETSEESWLQRIGESFMGVLVGIALVPISAGFLSGRQDADRLGQARRADPTDLW
jgi:hypothetical protein